MPKIPELEIERIKSQIDLVALIAASGVQLKKKGANWVGLCPFHNDKDPSLVVTPSKNLWNCLGACQSGGDALTWVMKLNHVAFLEAYEVLRQRLDGAGPTKKPATSVAEEGSSCVVSESTRQEILVKVITFYQESLKTEAKAQAYLEKRGLFHPEAIEFFRLGYAHRKLSTVIPSRQCSEGIELRAQLTELGIFRKHRGHEHFSGSVVFPVIDENGLIQEIYGRKTTQGLRPGTPMHTYLPGSHRGIWNPGCLIEKTVILCESIIDALTFWVHGFRNATASYGVNGFTPDHLAAFKNSEVQRLLIAYDRDEAGNEAAQALAKKLIPEGIACYRVLFPKNMDANAYALKVTPAEKSLGLVLEQAVWLGEGEEPKETQETVPVTFLPLAAQDPAPNQEESQELAGGILATMEGSDVIFTFEKRRYRVRGLEQNESNNHLKINLMVSERGRFHVDMLELYATKQRSAFIHQAAESLYCDQEPLRKDLGQILLKLEALQDDKAMHGKPKKSKVSLSEEEQREALQELRNPALLEKTLKDFETCGLIGEETNKLIGHLAAISRMQPDPLAIIIQSSSSAGKTALMDGILSFVPEEDMEKFTSMTGKSLFYMEEDNLKHKVLAIAEEEGAEEAIYPLKLLQSEKVLNIATTGKNPQTGRLGTETYRVEGPVSLLLTTTAIEMDEEFQNRCFVLAVDESREQTKAIHQIQREKETLEGMKKNLEKEAIIKRQQNMQRLLKPIYVVNPYAKELTFLDHKLRTRRDQMKYLALIRSIALLHQYQRPVKQLKGKDDAVMPYIEVGLDDIKVANRLVNETLGKSLDELTPQTRRFLVLLTKMVQGNCVVENIEQSAYRFTRKEIREDTGWSNFQVKKHIDRLVELEYLITHRGKRGQSFIYELIYQERNQNETPFMMGLIDIAKLQEKMIDKEYDGKNEPLNQGFKPPLSPQIAPNKPSLRKSKSHLNLASTSTSKKEDKKSPKKESQPYQKTASRSQSLAQ